MGVSVSGCKNRSQYSLIRPSVVLSPLCSSETLAWKMISWATQIKPDRKVLKLPGSFQVLVNGLTLCMAQKLKSGELYRLPPNSWQVTAIEKTGSLSLSIDRFWLIAL